MPFERTLLYGLILILVAAPLPFGAVQTEATALLAAACLGLGVVWVIGRSRHGLPALPWNDPVLIAGALFVLLGAAQIVPLPRPVLRNVSPEAVALRDRYEPATSLGGWRTISLYPWATRQATLRSLAYLLTILVTIDLCSVRANRRALSGLVLRFNQSSHFPEHGQVLALKRLNLFGVTSSLRSGHRRWNRFQPGHGESAAAGDESRRTVAHSATTR